MKPKEIRTEILIKAKPQKVWDVLADFENYPRWNSFIVSIKGKPEVGQKIVIKLGEPDDKKGLKVKSDVVVVDKYKKIKWLGHFFKAGMFDGEYTFELIDNNDGTTTLIHLEKFSGILMPLYKTMLDENIRNGIEIMSLQLRLEAEKEAIIERVLSGKR